LGVLKVSCELYSGTPGSGKSLHAAQRIERFLRRGKTVIANFPINLDYFKNRRGKMPKLGKFLYVQNQNLTVSFLKKYSKENFEHFKEHQGLIVIDECAVIFNPRINRDDRLEWINFLTQHRKYGYDILLISQSDCLIDRQIRPMIETEYKHRALSNYGLAGWILSEIFGKYFWVNSYWYGCKLKLSSDVFRFHKKQASLYNSFKIFDEDKKEKKEDGKYSRKVYGVISKTEKTV
jgi:zona occludens toxin